MKTKGQAKARPWLDTKYTLHVVFFTNPPVSSCFVAVDCEYLGGARLVSGHALATHARAMQTHTSQ